MTGKSWTCVEYESRILDDAPALGPVPTGTFLFEGVEIHVTRSVAGWRLQAAGHEVTNTHLGTAARILFDPEFHSSTSELVREILAWAAHSPHSTRAA